MNVTVTTPNPAFTGNITLQDGAVVLGFTAGTTGSIDVPPTAFGAIVGAGLTLTIGTPSPGPGYDANLDQVVAPLVGAGASATSAALRAAYGRAAPVLSAFSYDATTGNLLSYQEDGITITLTYNSDGTVATSKRGTDATQAYSYSGGNLTGVA